MTDTPTGERGDLLAMLDRQRGFLHTTIDGLSDDQARATPTVSELSLGGLVKHVTAVEESWLDFIEQGPSAKEMPADMDWDNPPAELLEEFHNGFRMLPEESLEQLWTAYERTAERSRALLATVDLDESHPLPAAPWFEPGATWTNRTVFLQILSESSQHSGHADIIRETIDGQKTMG